MIPAPIQRYIDEQAQRSPAGPAVLGDAGIDTNTEAQRQTPADVALFGTDVRVTAFPYQQAGEGPVQ